MLTVFNAAPAPTAPLPDELWGLCDVLCVNEPELQLLTGKTDAEAEAACTELLKRGVGAVLLTRGKSRVPVGPRTGFYQCGRA